MPPQIIMDWLPVIIIIAPIFFVGIPIFLRVRNWQKDQENQKTKIAQMEKTIEELKAKKQP